MRSLGLGRTSQTSHLAAGWSTLSGTPDNQGVFVHYLERVVDGCVLPDEHLTSLDPKRQIAGFHIACEGIVLIERTPLINAPQSRIPP